MRFFKYLAIEEEQSQARLNTTWIQTKAAKLLTILNPFQGRVWSPLLGLRSSFWRVSSHPKDTMVNRNQENLPKQYPPAW